MKFSFSFEVETNAEMLVMNNCASRFNDMLADSARKHLDFLFDELCRQFDFSETTKENLQSTLIERKKGRK